MDLVKFKAIVVNSVLGWWQRFGDDGRSSRNLQEASYI